MNQHVFHTCVNRVNVFGVRQQCSESKSVFVSPGAFPWSYVGCACGWASEFWTWLINSCILQ